ncbi:MAG: glycosyltransferase family 4 protein [Bacteroidales bacterium]|nr:glycosyltransferase family 4 protein [Bacteroidales bacterium]
MNILFLTYQGYPGTGSTFSIAYLARGLAGRGHNVYVGCPSESHLAEILKDSGVQVEPMVFRNKVDFKNVKHIVRLARQKEIDIINAQSGRDRYTSILAKKLYRIKSKIILTRRQTPRSVGGFLQNWFYVSGTEQIVVNSNQLKNEFTKMGIPEKHLKVIFNGIPVENFDLIDEAIVSDLKIKHYLKKDDIVIGCVSRRKKQYQLLEALTHLPDHIKVIFVGIEPGILDELILEKGLKNEFIYAGIVDKKTVMNYYKLFDVMVLPSTTEGFGLVLVEAMGAGTPVIGTRAAGIIDVLDDQKNGLWYEDENTMELAEKINQVLHDAELRDRLIENGKNAAFERFSIEQTVFNYEQFFQSVLKN